MFRPLVAAVGFALALCAFPQARPDQPQAFAAGKRWAIVVGANNYLHFGKLNYAVADAKGIADTLISRYRFSKETVRVLTDDGGPESIPSAGNILGELDVILSDKRLDKSDLFLFFFAGHGIGMPEGDFLMPADARRESYLRIGVAVKEIIERFTKAGLKNVLVIADACREGKENPFGAELERLGRETKIAVMLGCKPGQRSMEAPEMGHGAFAGHLLKALQDENLRDLNSGAVWASTIAKKVQEQVRDYTERDLGPEGAQTPAIWAEKTEDVLLGAFPVANGSEAVKNIRARGETLDRDAYVSAITEFAEQMIGADRWPEALELLHTANELGGLTVRGKYLLGIALTAAGRQREADEQFAQVFGNAPNSVYGQMSLIFHSSGFTTPADVVEAAKNVMSLVPCVEAAFACFVVLDRIAARSDEIGLLEAALKVPNLTERYRLAFEGWLARAQGDMKAGAARMAEAAAVNGNEPQEWILRWYEYLMMDSFKPKEEMVAYLDSRIAAKDHLCFWLLAKAGILRGDGKRKEATATVKSAIKEIDVDDYLVQAAIVAELGIAEMVPELQDAAKRLDTSWTAALVLAFAESLAKEKTIPKVPFDLERKAENAAVFRSTYYYIAGQLVRQLLVDHQITHDQYSEFLHVQFLNMSGARNLFGVRREAWEQLLIPGVEVRPYQTALLVRRWLARAIKDGEVTPALAGLALPAAACGGDEDLAQMALPTALKDLEQLGLDREVAASYLALRGQLLAGYESVAISAYLSARAGKKAEAKEKLKDYKPANEQDAAFAGLAWSLLGDSKRALEMFDDLVGAIEHNQAFLAATVIAERHRLLRAAGKAAEADQDLHDFLYSRLPNPVYRNLHFGVTSAVKEFAGEYRSVVKGATDHGDALEDGTLAFTISPTGAMSGSYESVAGKVRVLKGTVDANGNLTGTVKGDGKEWSLFAKLPQHKLWETFEPFKTEGLQLGLLTDEDGIFTLWVAHRE